MAGYLTGPSNKYIGNQPIPQSTQNRETFTATAGQTSFATVGFTPNFVDVFLNGVHLLNGTDYSDANGSDIVLTSGAAAGDVLEVISYSTFEVNSQNFTGDTTISNLDVTGTFTGANLTLSGGLTSTNAITASGGIYLGGTGAANLLDDYEEGTWTPTVDGSATTGVGTYNSQLGTYVKVGDLVYVSAWVSLTAHNGSGNILLGSLPFTPIGPNTTYGFQAATIGFFSNVSYTSGWTPQAYLSPIDNKIIFGAAIAGAPWTQIALDTNFEIVVSVTYRTA